MKLEIDNIEKLMEIVESEKLTELSYKTKDFKVTLKSPVKKVKNIIKENNTEPAKISKPAKNNQRFVTSEGIGKYFYKIKDDKNGNEIKEYIKVGKEISVGDILGYVRTIGISSPIISRYSGIIEEIYVSNGAIIDYGKQLIKIKAKN